MGTIEDLMVELVNAKNGKGLVEILVNTGVEIQDTAGLALDELSGHRDFNDILFRWPDKEAEGAADIIMDCRSECSRSLDNLDLLRRSDLCQTDMHWVCVYCAVARDLSFASFRAEVLLDAVRGDARILADCLMRDFHAKVACLERMGYRWLGRKGQPRQGRSRTGYEISAGMNFGPLRPARSRGRKVCVERMTERGLGLMVMAQIDWKPSFLRRGR